VPTKQIIAAKVVVKKVFTTPLDRFTDFIFQFF